MIGDWATRFRLANYTQEQRRFVKLSQDKLEEWYDVYRKTDWINQDNINWAIENVRGLMTRWGNHPAVYALEPVNEPWWNTDIPTLKDFYRSVRSVIREFNPEVKFVFHDSFIPDASVWNDLFADDDTYNVVVDTHQYMAWWEAKSDIGTYCDVYGANLR